MVLTPMERALESMTRQIERARDDVGAGTGVFGDAALDLGPDLARTHEHILHGALALSGLQAESMVHDAAWLLMDLGRRIERVITLADLTRTLFEYEHPLDMEQALLESYLSATESSVIYRRRNRGLYRAEAVAELLMFDETNPRAMIYQLTKMHDDLVSLPEALRSAAAERAVEEMTAELRRCGPADLSSVDGNGQRAELVELTSTLRDRARALSDLLNRTRFAPPRTAQPIWGGQL